MTTATNDQIKVLVELQKVDAEIYRLRQGLSQHPVQKKKFEEELEKKKSKLKSSEESLKSFQVKQKGKENDLLSAEEKIKKLQGQLYQLKSNKEYQTMEMEIKGMKADKSLLEEEILKLLDDVDAAKGTVAKEKENFAVEEKKFKETSAALDQEAVKINGQIQSFEEQRRSHLPGADAKLIAQYDKILKSREGLAIVPVVNEACGGCHLGLPPQVVNELQRRDKIHFCESCARMLYWAAG